MIWWKEQLMSYLRHCCAIFENSASAIEPTFAQPMHCILCYLWNHFSTKIKENKIFSFFVFAPSVWCLANSRHVQLQEWSIWLNTKRWHVKEVKMSDGLWHFACGDVSHICDNWYFYIFNRSPVWPLASLAIQVILVESKQDWRLTETARNVSQFLLQMCLNQCSEPEKLKPSHNAWYWGDSRPFLSAFLSNEGVNVNFILLHADAIFMFKQSPFSHGSESGIIPNVDNAEVPFQVDLILSLLQEMHLSALKLKTYPSSTKIKRPTDSLCDKSQPRILKCQNNVSATNTNEKNDGY